MSRNLDVVNPDEKTGSYHLKVFLKSMGVMLGLIILTLICLVPIYLIVVNAFRTEQNITNTALSFLPEFGTKMQIDGEMKDVNAWQVLVQNLHTAKVRLQFDALPGFRNSLIISVSSTILTIFFSCLTAYGLCVYDFKIKDSAFTFVVAVMMVPTQVMGVGFIRFMMNFFGMKLTGTYWPLIIPAIAAPAVVFFMCQNMKSTFPFDIIEAARIDGCGEFRTFLTIGLPMLKPAIAVQAIFAFVASWNNFYTPQLILGSSTDRSWEKRTMPLMIAGVLSNDNVRDKGAQAAVISLSILPLIIAYVTLSRFIIEGVALGGVKE
ncbi:L-arabinose transport system permease protein AraQ [Clostridia bacterium]|nr:L-arabinose transport system permease protein AraQ [Clostridia bacterium]